MKNFFSKNIKGSETLGDKLRQLREEEGASLADVSQATKIRLEYLSYLEQGQYEKLPGEVYIRNFLKQYAGALRIDPEKVLALYEKEQTVYRQVKPPKFKEAGPHGIDQPKLIFSPSLVKKSLIVLAVAVLVFYLAIEVHGIISPPGLTVESPPDNLVTNQRTVVVSGQVEGESKVYINGQEVLGNPEGMFEETLDLQSGVNVITITAKKKHSKESRILRKIMVEKNDQNSLRTSLHEDWAKK